jgi:hypothetical protein
VLTSLIRYTLSLSHNTFGFPTWRGETVELAVGALFPFPAYALSTAQGRRGGEDEQLTLVTYLGSETDEGAVLTFAEAIAEALLLDHVPVTVEPVRVAFVHAKPKALADEREVA